MNESPVAIIDAGGANLASLTFALARLGAASCVTSDAAVIRDAERVILPGVGAAADAMQRLRTHRLDELVPTLRQPVLGICLGLQLLGEASEEDAATCLGVLHGRSSALEASPATPVPNMGWCTIQIERAHPLLAGIADNSYFYFVHSYAIAAGAQTLATADHGQPFSAIMAHENFMATQFHPERSAKAGAKLLQNFLEIPT